ncbi:FAD-dependent oxidoreductase [Candidatus Chloroploca sp. Khr17]|uniref:FAD-dependent oxidoreductase n=1 Tax=Candidatus Chloroploca sp. Khr17 TaxID=2496869 RepID=UPI00101D8684|nr:FAD-dependent oxidoreductase [Candidatus Chloroploca sp. Khr17]
MHNDRIAVLGAGLQGACVALALARLGYRVNLFERMDDCLTQASLRNEGKIHLGFVYANDTSFQTADLMLRSALSFGPNMEAFLGQKIDWSQFLSNPFIMVTRLSQSRERPAAFALPEPFKSTKSRSNGSGKAILS